MATPKADYNHDIDAQLVRSDSPKTILVTGANGYIGTRLLMSLYDRGHRVLAVVRNKNRLRKDLVESMGSQLVIIEADFSSFHLPDISEKVDAAYYLLHSMSSEGDFVDTESQCAFHFVSWIKSTCCEQIVYLGALMPEGVDKDDLSSHLESREKVQNILQASKIPLTTLRASIIVGSGSASFEMIRDLVEKLPVMITPKWVRMECQPIAVRNIIEYLVGVIEVDTCKGEQYDVGGPELLSYGDMLGKYARLRGLKRWIIPVPLFSLKLSSHWLKLMTATNIYLAKNLVSSLSMKTVCQEDRIKLLIPQKLLSYDEAIERAFSKIAQNMVPSTWYDSLVSGELRHEQLINVNVPEHGVYTDERSCNITATEAQCIDAVWSLGGKNGWPSMHWAWVIRGIVDKMFGGIGMRRGRRHPEDLRNGDALDFWRVILADRERGRLIMYAEMKLPGEAWLEYHLKGGELIQKATFRPTGIMGRLYWLSVYPFHGIIFPRMVKRLADGWPDRSIKVND